MFRAMCGRISKSNFNEKQKAGGQDMDKDLKQWEIDCVIYDCDGVMFDSLEANRRLYCQIALSMGREPLTEDEVQYCHTHTVYESLRYMFRENEELEKKAVELLKKEINFKDFIVYLKMEPNLTQMNIDADFIGIGRIDYLVYNPESDVAAGEIKERDEMSRINHMFVGNFSIEEQILVAKDHMCENGYLPCA